MKKLALHVLVLLLILPTAAIATRPARSSATLEVTFASRLTTGDAEGQSIPYTVEGCGYDGTLGGVTVVVRSPVAISFAGQLPDANGCIAVTNFSTQGSGHYEVEAWQKVRNRSRMMASTSFDV